MKFWTHCDNPAPGGPGVASHWTRGDKDAIGTAYSTASHVWFTVAGGMIEEVYYPTIDRPQVRDLQYLITDGETFCHDERRDLESRVERLAPPTLGVRVINIDPAGRYTIHKEIIADPHFCTVLIHTRLEAKERFRDKLKLFALIAPHLAVEGRGSNGHVVRVGGRRILFAYKEDAKESTCLALGATTSFRRGSCGYVGVNDGWTDLADNKQMDWEFDCALDGNIALMGELDLELNQEFTLCLAFGQGFHDAVTTLFQSLSVPFSQQRDRFVEQWERAHEHKGGLVKATSDDGALYHMSQSLLLAHEDKLYPGALIASLSIPWGEVKTDTEGGGGYHIVWTRDLVNSATGLLATGNTATALRALIYLAVAQRPDGGFYQNFWVNGDPYREGVQLDQVAYPIILAWRLNELHALDDYDPYPMVFGATHYLIAHGPATPQERWEEASGYSPSTLAINIAALICAASLIRRRGDATTADFVQDYADFLERHVEDWTVTTQGTLVPDIPRHFIRIHPVDMNDPQPDENPNAGKLFVTNRPPGSETEFAAKNIVSPDFLELVRYGIRNPGDALIEDSLRVVDHLLRVDTPLGPSWRRYNHDGYGQRPDGSAFAGWGQGRAWPLLTGERGHYELAAGRSVSPFIRALERMSGKTGLLPEQIWDQADLPDQRLYFGGPTGAAMPLMWAHAEYIKLLRSAVDGKVFDLLPPVAERYLGTQRSMPCEIWKFNRQVRSVVPGCTLRILAQAPFRLHWSQTGWHEVQETDATPTALGISFVDIETSPSERGPIAFTFFWLDEDKWEGRDYHLLVEGV